MNLFYLFLVGSAVALNVPTVTLAPGVHMPLVGLGTWLYNDTVAEQAVADALEIGYTAFDCAFVYNNSIGVGNAIKNYLEKTGTPRSKLFITSKVMTGAGVPGSGNLSMYDLAIKNLKELQLDYVDLMLLHFPCSQGAKTCDGSPAFRQDQWKSVERLIANNKSRSIGVSHYCPHHLKDIFKIMTVKPVINQVQYHVGMGMAPVNATDGKQFDESNGIIYQSFSPLCGPCGTQELLNGPLVTSIGKAHNKTGAQVSLKWQVQQGIPIIPKTNKVSHMKENIDLFGWLLTADEMFRLTAATTPPVAGPSATDAGDCSFN